MSFPALSRERGLGLPVRGGSPTERPAAPAPREEPAAVLATRRLAGRYRYDVADRTWWWSPEMFTLNGLPADGAEATTELLLEHLHPEDRARTLAGLTGACTEARPFTLRIRIVRADGAHRAAVLLGEPETDADGTVTAVAGILLDLTDCPPPDGLDGRSDALETEIAQMRAAMASRAAIEQAKGILMLLTSCSDSVAFDLLAHISSHTHRKVRDVAESITESAAGHAQLPEDVRAIVRDACPPARRGH
jgi:hypothetical protein